MLLVFYHPALALLGQGLKKSPIRQKLDFANHPYLCKGLSYSTGGAFVAVKADGSITVWGDPNNGGLIPTSD
jgi:hypothetical protein